VVVEVTSDEYPVGTIRNVFDRMVRDTAAE